MSSRRFHVEYAPLAVENLRAFPKTVASQIVRKISRLEQGLHGNIKQLRQTDFGYRYAWVIIEFCSMSKMIQS